MMFNATERYGFAFLNDEVHGNGLIAVIERQLAIDQHIDETLALIKGGEGFHILLQQQLAVLGGFAQQQPFPGGWDSCDHLLGQRPIGKGVIAREGEGGKPVLLRCR
ncbi:MAG: hypothetical protein BWY83_02780 [bacterium ADurb.Bin478]|nr:MAG: hypothetical protein BWY83_02780 [bacterium ADurb.Bin478]